MEEQGDEICQLFHKAFNEHISPLENGEWEALGKTLQKHNFFRFNAFQFNIYYASTIVFCFLICLGVGSHYTYTHVMRPHHLEDTSKILNPVPMPTRELAIPTSSNTKHENLETRTKTSGIHEDPKERPANPLFGKILGSSKSMEKNEEANKESNSPFYPDTAVHFQATKDGAKTDSAKIKPRRTLYITKQDTVFEYDTLRAPKRKKKWFK